MIRREPSDARAVVGRRIDWLSVAFRVRFPEATISYMLERARYARKHGAAAADLAGELWQMAQPKGPAWWLESEARGERLEVCPTAPGGYPDGAGEIVPGFSFALHVSGFVLAVGRTSDAIRRAWRLARRAGTVFEGRVRRVDVTADFRGVDVDALEEARWHVLPRVGVAMDREDGRVVEVDRDGGARASRGGGRRRDEPASGVHARAADPNGDGQLALLPRPQDHGVDLRAGRGSQREDLRQDSGARFPRSHGGKSAQGDDG